MTGHQVIEHKEKAKICVCVLIHI